MRNGAILITDVDMKKLEGLIESFRFGRGHDLENLEALEAELNRAEVLDKGSIPGDVVTMNSRVRVVDLATGKESAYQVVYPRDANIAENKISVLAPIGTALLGYRVGSVIEWSVPSGTRRFKITAVEYQPEAKKEVA